MATSRNFWDDRPDEPIQVFCYESLIWKRVVKTHPTLTPPEIGGFALIMLGFKSFQRGHLWIQKATP